MNGDIFMPALTKMVMTIMDPIIVKYLIGIYGCVTIYIQANTPIRNENNQN